MSCCCCDWLMIDRSEVWRDPGHGLINVISTLNTGAWWCSARSTASSCVENIFIGSNVTMLRRGGAGACRNLGPGSTRPPGHPGMCITGPGHVEGQLGQRVGTSESMSAHNQSWPLAPGQQGTWSHTGHYRYLAMCVSPTISDNLYMNCRKNH